MMADLPVLIETGKTTNPYFAKISLARTINLLSGGAVIAPWDVDQLDEPWQDAFRVMYFEAESYRQQQAALKQAKDKWLASHPTYRKYNA